MAQKDEKDFELGIPIDDDSDEPGAEGKGGKSQESPEMPMDMDSETDSGEEGEPEICDEPDLSQDAIYLSDEDGDSETDSGMEGEPDILDETDLSQDAIYLPDEDEDLGDAGEKVPEQGVKMEPSILSENAREPLDESEFSGGDEFSDEVFLESEIEDEGFNRTGKNELAGQFGAISRKMDSLHKEFESKLKYDAYKDKLIDSLHKELQSFKGDLVKKHVQSMIMDVIKVIDDIRKLTEHYTALKPEEIEPEKLLNILERIPSDLEDIFFYQGVKPFVCENSEFDPRRQRVLKRLKTSDPLKDKTVAESLRPGYEWEERILRPEMVAVYLYNEPSVEEHKGNSDE